MKNKFGSPQGNRATEIWMCEHGRPAKNLCAECMGINQGLIKDDDQEKATAYFRAGYEKGKTEGYNAGLISHDDAIAEGIRLGKEEAEQKLFYELIEEVLKITMGVKTQSVEEAMRLDQELEMLFLKIGKKYFKQIINLTTNLK